jgi:hypothetical protein
MIRIIRHSLAAGEAEGDVAPGNFFRIIGFDVIRFFDSVSRDARVFESRVNFFAFRAPEFAQSYVDRIGTREGIA